jgi:hypothetical protein
MKDMKKIEKEIKDEEEHHQPAYTFRRSARKRTAYS